MIRPLILRGCLAKVKQQSSSLAKPRTVLAPTAVLRSPAAMRPPWFLSLYREK